MLLSHRPAPSPAQALALLGLPTVGSSKWKWESFLEERLKGQLISSVLWDNAGKEEAALGLGTALIPPWWLCSQGCLRRSCQPHPLHPSAG